MNKITKGIILLVIGIILIFWGFYTGRGLFLLLGGVLFLVGIGFIIYDAIKNKTQSVSPVRNNPVTPTPKNSDDTQFYACPHCGGNTELRYGKQYCGRCRVYL